MFTLLISYFIAHVTADTYKVFPQGTVNGFYEADEYCEILGGHLASIHNEETNNYVSNLLKDNGAVGYGWIGYNLKSNSWTDNSPVDYTATIVNSAHDECTAIVTDDALNRWAPVPCSNPYAFVCQIPSAQQEESCNHIDGLATNNCYTYLNDLGSQESYNWVCIDANTIEDRIYSGGDCDSLQFKDSYPYECTQENNCYCGAPVGAVCDTVEVKVTMCDSNQQEVHHFVKDKCLPESDSGTGSYLYHCKDSGEFVWQSYTNDNCAAEGLDIESVFPTSCAADGEGVAVICSLDVEETVDSIVSDCAGNEQERDTLTINKCLFEQFPNGPSRPYVNFCNENNQLAIRYYISGEGNCDGSVQLERISDSDPNGPCFDGLRFSSTCGGDVTPKPIETTQPSTERSVDRINSDCAGNENWRDTVTINKCQFDDNPDNSYYYQWFCDANNVLGTKYYTKDSSGNCDANEEVNRMMSPLGCQNGMLWSSTCGDAVTPYPTEQPIPIATSTPTPATTMPAPIKCEQSQECASAAEEIVSAAVYCTGYRACANSRIRADRLFIQGHRSVEGAQITAEKIFCYGSAGAPGSFIFSDGIPQMDAYFYGFGCGSNADLYCGSGSTCNVYCDGKQGCNDLTITVDADSDININPTACELDENKGIIIDGVRCPKEIIRV